MDFFQGDKGEQTGQCATNRLQVILMHDRTKLDAITMNKMREELIGVFSKYVIIDKDELEIGLKSEGDSVALMLNIPIVRTKTEEELAEVLKESEEEAAAETADESAEDEDRESAEDENVEVEPVSEIPSEIEAENKIDEEQEETVEEAEENNQETEEETSSKENNEVKSEENKNK